jgi:ABC-2 type transport system ATP-binding protein
MKTALSIKNLTKTYASGHEALKGIDLEIGEGDFFALLGPNGAGKSTAIGIVCALVNRSGGSVSIFGHDIVTEAAKARSYIGLVPQEFNFNIFEPVMEIVINQAGYYGIDRKTAKERAQKYLEELNLWDKRYEQARELSGGMKRRLMIARALVHNPKLLILDEPTAGVDIEIRRSMWQFMENLNKEGTTIILTTHYLEEAESLCRNIAIIDDGELIENTSMKQLLARLQMETFVLDLAQPVDEVPQCEDRILRLLDPTTIEVEVHKGDSLNRLFSDLGQQGIDVVSMRNKSNRLEQLFMHLVENSGPGGDINDAA